AWLVTIAHRKANDQHRARARRAVPVGAAVGGDGDGPAARGGPDAGAGGIGGAVAPVEPDLDLWDALAALPPKQRQAVAYHYLAGLPYAGVAEISGGTEAAARRAAADGIRTLRTRYPLEETP
ncbi:MAG TPA: sigma factor-like helix-turn-helix DNA-binding protein, partial [Pseudonocardiaceae bacterium]